MALNLTPTFANEKEYFHQMGRESQLFNQEDYDKVADKDAYMQVMASTLGKESSTFDQNKYDTFYDPDLKLSYIMDSFYGDANDAGYQERMKTYQAQYENDLNRRAYDNMDIFSKIASNVFVTPVLGTAKGIFNLIDGLWNIGKDVVGWFAGEVAYAKALSENTTENKTGFDKILSNMEQSSDTYVDPEEARTKARNDIILSSNGLVDFISGSTTDELFQPAYDRLTAIGKGGFWSGVVGLYAGVFENLARELPMFILNPLGTTAAAVGQGIYYASMLGNTMQEAVESNPNISNANLLMYTAAVGGTEIATNKLFGDYVFGKGLFDPAQAALNIKNEFGKTLAYLGIRGLSEASEEMSAEIIENGLYNMFVGQKDLTIQEVMYAGLMGGLLGVIGDSVGIARTKSTNGLTKLDTYVNLMEFKDNTNSLYEELNKNSKVAEFKYKHPDVDITNLPDNLKTEYNTAVNADYANSFNIAKYQYLMAEYGNKLGVEGVAKANELLNYTIEQQASQARLNSLYEGNAKLKADSRVKLYNKYNKDGSKFIPTDTLTAEEYQIMKGLKAQYPEKTFVFGDVVGRPNWEWEGATTHENTVFINREVAKNKSAKYFANNLVSHEIIHTFQRIGGVLNNKSMDLLDSLMKDLYGITIDYDSVQFGKDFAYNDNPLMTRAEKQAIFYTQQLLYNKNFIKEVYKADSKLIKKTYSWLNKYGKNLSTKKVKSKNMLRELNAIMATYRTAIAMTITNETDARAVCSDFDFTELQTENFMTSYLTPNQLDDHMLLSKVDVSPEAKTYKLVKHTLIDNFKPGIDATSKNIGDVNSYTKEFLNSIGYTPGSDFIDVLNDYLAKSKLMYVKPLNVLITRSNFKNFYKDVDGSNYVTDITKMVESIKKLNEDIKKFYNKSNYDKLMSYQKLLGEADLRYKASKITDLYKQIAIKYKSMDDIYDVENMGDISKEKASEILITHTNETYNPQSLVKVLKANISYDDFSLGSTMKTHIENDVLNTILYLIDNDVNDIVQEIVNTTEHEVTHAIAYTDGLFRGGNPEVFKRIIKSQHFSPEQERKLIDKMQTINPEVETIEDVAEELYYLVFGEQLAEIHDESFGSLNGNGPAIIDSEPYLETLPDYKNIPFDKAIEAVTYGHNLTYNSNLKWLEEFIPSKKIYVINTSIKNSKKIDRRGKKRVLPNGFKYQHNEKIKNLILNFSNNYKLNSVDDFINFGFTKDFINSLTEDNTKQLGMNNFNDMIRNNEVANSNSENYNTILQYLVDNVISSDMKDKFAEAYYDSFAYKKGSEEAKSLIQSSGKSLKQLNEELKESVKKGTPKEIAVIEGMKIVYKKNIKTKENLSGVSKEISFQQELKAEDATLEDVVAEEVSAIDQETLIKAREYEEVAASNDNLAMTLILMAKRDKQKILPFIKDVYNDLRLNKEAISQKTLDRYVRAINAIYKKAGKDIVKDKIINDRGDLNELIIDQIEKELDSLEKQGKKVDKYRNQLVESKGDIVALQQLAEKLKTLETKEKEKVSKPVEEVKEVTVPDYYKKFINKDGTYNLEIYTKSGIEKISNINETKVNELTKDKVQYADLTAKQKKAIATKEIVSRETSPKKEVIDSLNKDKKDVQDRIEQAKENIKYAKENYMDDKADKAVAEEEQKIKELKEELKDVDEKIDAVNKSTDEEIQKQIDAQKKADEEVKAEIKKAEEQVKTEPKKQTFDVVQEGDTFTITTSDGRVDKNLSIQEMIKIATELQQKGYVSEASEKVSKSKKETDEPKKEVEKYSPEQIKKNSETINSLDKLLTRTKKSQYQGDLFSDDPDYYYTVSKDDLKSKSDILDKITPEEFESLMTQLSIVDYEDFDYDKTAKRLAIKNALIDWAYEHRNTQFKSIADKITRMRKIMTTDAAQQQGLVSATWGGPHTIESFTSEITLQTGEQVIFDDNFLKTNLTGGKSIEEFIEFVGKEVDRLTEQIKNSKDPFEKYELRKEKNHYEMLYNQLLDGNYSGALDNYLVHKSQEETNISKNIDEIQNVYTNIVNYIIQNYDLENKKISVEPTARKRVLSPDAKEKIYHALKSMESFRYLMMLASPTTAGRNAVSNTFVDIQAIINDTLASGLERVTKTDAKTQIRYNGDFNEEFSQFVDETFGPKIKDEIQGSKYNKSQKDRLKAEKAKKMDPFEKSKLKKYEDKVLSDTPWTYRRAMRNLKNTLAGARTQILDAANIKLKNMYRVKSDEDIKFKINQSNKELANLYNDAISDSDTSLISLIKLANKLDLDIIQQIYTDALYRADYLFFKTENWASKAIKNLEKNSPAAAMLLRTIVPFIRVNVNTSNYILNHSPIGLVKGIIKLIQTKNMIFDDMKSGINNYYKTEFVKQTKKEGEDFKFKQDKFDEWRKTHLSEEVNKAIDGDKESIKKVGAEMEADGKIHPGERDIFSRAKAIESISQGMTGTAALIVGALLAALTGAIGYDDDEQYIGPYLKIGDLRIKLNDMSPFNTLFVAGAMLGSNKIDNKFETFFSVLIDQSFFNVFESALTYSDSILDFVQNQTINYLQSFIPAPLKNITKMFNIKNDKTGNFFVKLLKTTASNLPGFNFLVQAKINPYTGEKERIYESGYIEAALNQLFPIGFRIEQYSDIEKEAMRVGAETTGTGYKISINGIDYSVKGNAQFAKDRANYVSKELKKLFSSSKYSRMSDKEKETAIKSVYRHATESAKINYWTSLNKYRVFTTNEEYLTYKDYLTSPSYIRRRYNGYKGSKYIG